MEFISYIGTWNFSPLQGYTFSKAYPVMEAFCMGFQKVAKKIYVDFQ